MEDGRPLKPLFNLSVRGAFFADKGSPDANGNFWTASGTYPPDTTSSANSKLGVIIRKQEAMRRLFSNQGRVLYVQTDDGSIPALKCNPRNIRIEFPDGGQGRVSWVDKCDYTITMQADVISIGGSGGIGEDTGDLANYHVSKANEEWNIEVADEKNRTYRLTHSLSAVGRLFYSTSGTLDKLPWENAKDYVLNRIGLGLDTARMQASGVINGTGLNAYNYLRTNAINEMGGTFQASETWICFDPGSGAPALDEYTVQIRESQEGKKTVTVEGTLTGFEKRHTTNYTLESGRYVTAQAKWAEVQPQIFTRASDISQTTLHPTPLQTSEGHNPVAGVITYNREYDNRPNPMTSGARSEIVNIVSQNQADVYAAIPVLGRLAGPVLQSIGTKTPRKRSIQVEILMPAKTQVYTPTQPVTTGIIFYNIPSYGTGVIFVDRDEEVWNANTGRYNRTVDYTWEP